MISAAWQLFCNTRLLYHEISLKNCLSPSPSLYQLWPETCSVSFPSISVSNQQHVQFHQQLLHTLSHSMPSTWYHLITPPVKIFGCWKGTGCPLNLRTGSRNCLALCRTAWHNLSLMTLFESPFFCRSSGHRLSEELSSYRGKFKEHMTSGMHIKAQLRHTFAQFTPVLMISEVSQHLTQSLILSNY